METGPVQPTGKVGPGGMPASRRRGPAVTGRQAGCGVGMLAWGRRGLRWHHLLFGEHQRGAGPGLGAWGRSLPPGGLTVRPCLSFPTQNWDGGPYLLLRPQRRPPLASRSPPPHGAGGAVPRVQRPVGRGAGERWHGRTERRARGRPGHRRRPAEPRAAERSRAPPNSSRAQPSSAETHRALAEPSRAEPSSSRVEPSVAELRRDPPSSTRALPSAAEPLPN